MNINMQDLLNFYLQLSIFQFSQIFYSMFSIPLYNQTYIIITSVFSQIYHMIQYRIGLDDIIMVGNYSENCIVTFQQVTLML